MVLIDFKECLQVKIRIKDNHKLKRYYEQYTGWINLNENNTWYLKPFKAICIADWSDQSFDK